jgi:uncharacterized protein
MTMETINRTKSGSEINTRRSVNASVIIAGVITLIGGLNWGLVGIANFDLVAALFGDDSTVSRLIYILVALAATYTFFALVSRYSRDVPRTV